MKKNGGNEPIGVHICMEMSQRNSLCSYLYLKQTKMSLLFSSTKSDGRTGSAQGRVWYQWEWERVSKGEYSANTVYTCI
jgi:hypothetical protein